MRESHSLGAPAIAFTERPAYFNGLITHIESLDCAASETAYHQPKGVIEAPARGISDCF